MENSVASTADKRLHRLACNMANPSSAPVLAKIVSRRQRHGPRMASERLIRVNCSCNRTNARTAPNKYAEITALWMNRQPENLSDEDEVECYITETSQNQAACHELSQQSRLDLQTNNSKKQGASPDSWQRKSPPRDGSESSEDERSSELTEATSLENASAVAKGADAMVKMSLSRQTEIIDTSKLVEEGKVEVEYDDTPEVIEEQDHAMVDEYEKTFAYARRLRALLNMQFKDLDRGIIDTNFLLIKAHEHPTQKMIDRWRNIILGQSYNDQVKRQKQIEDFKVSALKKKGKKDQETRPVYPDSIRFSVRFRKDNSEKRWKDYLAFRQKQKKQSGAKTSGAVPKPNDKYVFAFLDVWSFNIVVFAKPSATVREIIDPVFSRIGLEHRADFTYTIGCFKNDKRAGKAKVLGVPNLPEPVEMYELASELYKKNCTEIYVNDNRCEIFSIFPDHYERNMPKKPGEEAKKVEPKDKKGKKKDKAGGSKKDGGKKEPNSQSPADQTGTKSPADKSPTNTQSKNNASESPDNWLNINESNVHGSSDARIPAKVESLSEPSMSVRTSNVAVGTTAVSVANIGAASLPEGPPPCCATRLLHLRNRQQPATADAGSRTL